MLEEAGEQSRRRSGQFILAGGREVSRKLRRAVNRGAIALDKHRLKKAEIHLGWLGWQQADFNEEVSRHVDEINRFERRQGQLLNERAEASEIIVALREEQAAKDSAFQSELEQLGHERRPLALAHETAAGRLAEKQREVRETTAHLKKITRGESLLARQLKTLGKTFPPPADLREQLLSIASSTAELGTRKKTLQTTLFALQKALPPLHADFKLRESLLAALDRKKNKAQKAQAAAARKHHKQVRSADRRKAAMEKQSRSLEKRKKLPFLAIGRALGDSTIAPMNQPEALAEVLRHRENIRRREQVIAESLAASAGGNPTELRKFCLLVSLVAVLVVALVLVLGHAR